MKLLATSDFHADWVTAGLRRFADVEKAVDETVRQAVAQRVDAYLFLGDLCDPDSGGATLRAVSLSIRVAQELRDEGIQSVWVAGNHDVIEDGSGETTLTPLRRVAERSTPRSIRVYEQPAVVELWPINGRSSVVLLALPYTASSHPYDPAAQVDRLRRAGHYVDSTLLVAAGHLMLDGVHPGSETTDMPRGRDVRWPIEALAAAGVKLLLGGHYHRQMVHQGVHVPGSLARLTFGEEQNAPGYLIVEVGE